MSSEGGLSGGVEEEEEGDVTGDLQESSERCSNSETETAATAGERKAGLTRTRFKTVTGMVFPQLTLDGGSETLTMKKSVLIVFVLYASHTFSAWGDRMWSFVLSLLLAILYPGSLLLPGVYGFLVQLFVAVFGTLVGDWVDVNPRMKVTWISLLIQNSLLVLCSVLLALMFQLDWDVCGHKIIFASLVPIVIILGAGANLATVANTISIEKDWIVVIADKHKDVLAVLNSNMRRIDLCCKLLAPAVTGIFLQWMGPFATTLFVASWNIISFFAELGLIRIVYQLIPPLARKKIRRKLTTTEELPTERHDDSNSAVSTDDDDEEMDKPVATVLKVKEKSKCFHCKKRTVKVCSKLVTPLATLKNGMKTYIKQDIALVGFAMASIYLTVLGFSGVTSAYLLTQGLRNDLIGVCQGLGAIVGVSGTVIFPFVRKRFGTVRTGLFGISTQLALLLFCVAAVFVPSHRIQSTASGYYTPVCSSDANRTAPNETQPSYAPHYPTSVFITPTLTPPLNSASSPSVTPSLTFVPSSSVTPPLTSMLSPSVTPHLTFAPSSSVTLPLTSATTSSLTFVPSSFVTPTLTFVPSPSATPHLTFAPSTSAVVYDRQSSAYSPRPAPSPNTSTSAGSGISVALILLLTGIIGCRIGLWTFDLAVQQLVQETVVEEERGVVGGVMNSMNSIMDMLHYVMVIAAPRPEHFGILTLISVAMVTLGWVLYAAYVRKSRGHFFHFRDFYKRARGRVQRRALGVASDGLGDEDDKVQLLDEDL